MIFRQDVFIKRDSFPTVLWARTLNHGKVSWKRHRKHLSVRHFGWKLWVKAFKETSPCVCQIEKRANRGRKWDEVKVVLFLTPNSIYLYLKCFIEMEMVNRLVQSIFAEVPLKDNCILCGDALLLQCNYCDSSLPSWKCIKKYIIFPFCPILQYK